MYHRDDLLSEYLSGIDLVDSIKLLFLLVLIIIFSYMLASTKLWFLLLLLSLEYLRTKLMKLETKSY